MVVGAGLALLACAPHSDSSRRNEKGAKLTKLSSNDPRYLRELGVLRYLSDISDSAADTRG
jgi:hypothetical protein